MLFYRQNPRGISYFTAFRITYKIKGYHRSRRPSSHQAELPRARVPAIIEANQLENFLFLIIKDLQNRD